MGLVPHFDSRWRGITRISFAHLFERVGQEGFFVNESSMSQSIVAQLPFELLRYITTILSTLVTPGVKHFF